MKKFTYKFRVLVLSAFFMGSAHVALAQAAIGTTTPDASAQLQIESANKGLLIPRVTSTSLVTAPAKSLLVYQTNAPEGYYYNLGTSTTPNWTRLIDASSGLTPSYGYASNSPGAVVAVILGGTLIPLPNNQALSNVTANGANTVFTVTTAGAYKIEYNINLTAALLISSRITKNGVPLVGTVNNPAVSVSSLRSSVIVNLAAGDQLSLQLFGLLGAATLQGEQGASLTITKL